MALELVYEKSKALAVAILNKSTELLNRAGFKIRIFAKGPGGP